MAIVLVHAVAVVGWRLGGATLWVGRCQSGDLSIHTDASWGVFACTFTGGMLGICTGLAVVGVPVLVLMIHRPFTEKSEVSDQAQGTPDTVRVPH